MDSVWKANPGSSPPAMGSMSPGFANDSGASPTVPGAYWFHMISQELLTMITAAGITPNAATLTQMRDATAVLARNAPFAKTNTYSSGTMAGVLQMLANAQMSVLDYGAVADEDGYGHGTDNSPAFVAAVAACWAALNTVGTTDYGGRLYVPSGWYLCNTRFTVHPDIHLVGDGKYISRLYVPNAFNDPLGLIYSDASTAPYSNVAGNPISISGLSVLAVSGGASSAATAIYANANGTLISDVWIGGFPGNGIVLNNTDCEVNDFFIEQSGYGITSLFQDVTISKGVVACGYGVVVNNNPIYTIPTGGAVSTTTITLPSSFNVAANLTGYQITMLTGAAAGTLRTITGYNGTTRLATFAAMGSSPADGDTFTLDSDPGTTAISDVRCEPCSQVGIYVKQGRRVQISNCSAAQNGNTAFTQGGIRVDNSSVVSIANFNAISAINPTFPGGAPTADAISVNSSAFVTITGGTLGFWQNGWSANNCQNVTVTGVQSTNNYLRGGYMNGGDQINVTGGSYSNNGTSAGTSDCGIESVNSLASAIHLVNGVVASGNGGVQDYGIKATVSGSGSTFIGGGTAALYNNTADIGKFGAVGRIFTAGVITTAGAMGMSAPSTTQINNYNYAGGASLGTTAGGVANLTNGGGASQTITTVTAGTLVNVLNLTGAGEFAYLAAGSANSTSRTTRMQVIVDGVTVFDATSGATTTLGSGVIAAGWAATGGAYGGDPIRFNSSIVVNVCSNVSSDTGGIYVIYTYNKTAS